MIFPMEVLTHMKSQKIKEIFLLMNVRIKKFSFPNQFKGQHVVYDISIYNPLSLRLITTHSPIKNEVFQIE
jgi:hypothetical protein